MSLSIRRGLKKRGLIAGMLSMLAALLTIVSVGATDNVEERGRREKARHFYLSAARQDAEGKSGCAAELYKRAYELDSTYVEAAYEYGIRRLGMPSDTLATSAEREVSRRIARKFIDRYPGDLFPNMGYSNLMERAENIEESIGVIESLLRHNPELTDLLPTLAGLYLDVHDFEKAMEAINAYEAAEGESLELTIRKAGMHLAMGDSVGAVAEVTRMVERNPGDIQYMVLKSQVESYVNRPDSALATALAAEKLARPGEGGGVKVQIADLYKQRGDSVKYDEKVYEALLSEDLDFDAKNSIMAYYIQNLLQQKGDPERSNRLFSVLLKQYPHEPELRNLASRYDASRGEFGKALEEIEYALDLDHRNPEYWEQAMVYAIMADNHAKVSELLQRARNNLREIPMKLYLYAGSDANVADNPREALALYEECLLKHFPGQEFDTPVKISELRDYLTLDNIQDLVSLYQQAGDAHYQLKEREKAFLNYENSLAIDSGNPLTLNNYAYFLIEEVKNPSEEALNKADEMSGQAVEVAPDNATYIDTRAWVLFRKMKFQEAKEMQMRAIEVAGEDISEDDAAEFYSHLGDILFMNGEPEEAVKAWKRAQRGKPEDELLKKKIKNKAYFYE